MPHHLTISSLNTALAAQCYICNRFWARLNAEQQSNLASVMSVDAAAGIDCEESRGYLTTCDLKDATRYGFPGCYLLQIIYTARLKSSARVKLILQPLSQIDESLRCNDVDVSNMSDRSWSLAEKWISECTTSHAQCNVEAKDRDWHPTRLLDVASTDASANIIRLMESQEVAAGSPYMTLSHRWGTSKPLQLRRETFEQLRAGILLESLPLTFRDAVLVTRRLSIRYLWIDALCILQNEDDLSDWIKEASLMHKVYSAAYCNISAAAASESFHGLFVSRDPALLICPTIKLSLGEHRPKEDYLISDVNFWDTEVSRAPINARGWVLQERILANRVLHFGERQLMWECGEKDAAETYPNGLDNAISSLSDDVRFKDLCPDTYIRQARRFRDPIHHPELSAHFLWVRVVEAYTRCQLTNPDDKLVALSGIAKRFSSILRDTYVAGMWRRYLASELTWSVDSSSFKQPDPDMSSRAMSYRAPSFSWACVDGAIMPGMPSDQGILLDIEAVQLEYFTDDHTGAIRGGYLNVRARLKQIQLIRRFTGGRDQWIMILNGIEISTMNDLGRQGESQPLIMLDDLRESYAEFVAGKIFYIVPARLSTNLSGNLYMLLLEALENDWGTYRRVGYARSFVKATQKALLEPKEQDAGFPCREYRDGQHSITII
ncbi:heterokaryon incompatibility protein [Glarea lozoyensis ATCC 20868]|uniref:Heterokaryon incompatibility protein n=1 Tax=Glarea lozoyensis (strain ATCC 20868 / MF5171) TaxID=1116229 RepID=S3CX90_GLAL2|nr:heterokaryon incompatibility protein [Glarea lozoyensis ATCC 20868]EPE30962.1 heterokaryon incompatibility protein [Glarea lozoyensis ATCC 20868]